MELADFGDSSTKKEMKRVAQRTDSRSSERKDKTRRKAHLSIQFVHLAPSSLIAVQVPISLDIPISMIDSADSGLMARALVRG